MQALPLSTSGTSSAQKENDLDCICSALKRKRGYLLGREVLKVMQTVYVETGNPFWHAKPQRRQLNNPAAAHSSFALIERAARVLVRAGLFCDSVELAHARLTCSLRLSKSQTAICLNFGVPKQTSLPSSASCFLHKTSVLVVKSVTSAPFSVVCGVKKHSYPALFTSLTCHTSSLG